MQRENNSSSVLTEQVKAGNKKASKSKKKGFGKGKDSDNIFDKAND
jgi:hypothetical protein